MQSESIPNIHFRPSATYSLTVQTHQPRMYTPKFTEEMDLALVLTVYSLPLSTSQQPFCGYNILTTLHDLFPLEARTLTVPDVEKRFEFLFATRSSPMLNRCLEGSGPAVEDIKAFEALKRRAASNGGVEVAKLKEEQLRKAGQKPRTTLAPLEEVVVIAASPSTASSARRSSSHSRKVPPPAVPRPRRERPKIDPDLVDAFNLEPESEVSTGSPSPTNPFVDHYAVRKGPPDSDYGFSYLGPEGERERKKALKVSPYPIPVLPAATSWTGGVLNQQSEASSEDAEDGKPWRGDSFVDGPYVEPSNPFADPVDPFADPEPVPSKKEWTTDLVHIPTPPRSPRTPMAFGALCVSTPDMWSSIPLSSPYLPDRVHFRAGIPFTISLDDIQDRSSHTGIVQPQQAHVRGNTPSKRRERERGAEEPSTPQTPFPGSDLPSFVTSRVVEELDQKGDADVDLLGELTFGLGGLLGGLRGMFAGANR